MIGLEWGEECSVIGLEWGEECSVIGLEHWDYGFDSLNAV